MVASNKPQYQSQHGMACPLFVYSSVELHRRWCINPLHDGRQMTTDPLTVRKKERRMVAIKETVALGDLEMHDSENGIELGQGSRRGVQTH